MKCCEAAPCELAHARNLRRAPIVGEYAQRMQAEKEDQSGDEYEHEGVSMGIVEPII